MPLTVSDLTDAELHAAQGLSLRLSSLSMLAEGMPVRGTDATALILALVEASRAAGYEAETARRLLR